MLAHAKASIVILLHKIHLHETSRQKLSLVATLEAQAETSVRRNKKMKHNDSEEDPHL